MQIKGKIPLIIVAGLAWVVIISSCANIGMPTGGPQDSIPPVLVQTQPKYKALNYKGKDVRLTFNEYINTESISEDLVISPPLDKRPVIRMRSKTLVIEFNKDLKDSTTYSLDFKNSVADNNEKNALENLRFSFSTGDVFDSLRVAGRVMDAFNLEPTEKALVMLHKNLHDSAVFTVKPNYIAKTDENGLFLIDNIAPGKYHLFAITDANSDLKYNEGAEPISFIDTLVLPFAEFHEELDTLVKGVDSLMVLGHTHFHPDPFYLRQFTEDIFEQYLDSYKRETRYKNVFVFNESVKDTFEIELVNTDASNWYQIEYNHEADSLIVWIADTTVARMDTLLMEVSYFQLDSASHIYVQKDTLQMTFADKPKEEEKRRKKSKDDDEDEAKKTIPVPQFNWETNLGSKLELNKSIGLISPEPLFSFDTTKINIFLTEDTLKTPLACTFEKDTTAWRSYLIHYEWEPETNYTLEIDSAAAVNIFGVSSRKVNKKFSTREEDYYGTIELNFSSVAMNTIVQLLKNNKEETVVVQKEINKDGVVVFDYLSPDKYKIKVIYDENENGKWDSGSFQDKLQPEKVSYVNEVIKVRSNWDNKLIWDLKPDITFIKNIRDLELEEQKRKEAEEKARKEAEQRETPTDTQEMFQGGSGSGSGIIRQ